MRRIYIDPRDLPEPSSEEYQKLNRMQQDALNERKKMVWLTDTHQMHITKLKCTDPTIDDEKGRFHPIDIFFYSAFTRCIGEIKVRNYKSTAFEDWAIETQKLFNMKKWLKENKNEDIEDIFLFNFFSDDVVFIWNLKYTKPCRSGMTETKWYHRDADGNRKDKKKHISYFHQKDAIKIQTTT